MTESNSISKLKDCLVKTGFVDSTSLMADICPIPDRVFVMHNSYALVVVYQSMSEEFATEVFLKEAKEHMHAFIRKTLLALENQKGLIIDGYLLIALNQEPDAETKETIREMELDTKVCRKHIVWPVGVEGDLDRLQFITILSLPEPLHSDSKNTTPFELSSEANALLSKYDDLGSLDRLLDAIRNGELADAD